MQDAGDEIGIAGMCFSRACRHEEGVIDMFRRRDPVCGVGVGRSTPYTVKYGKKTYYFDCAACKHTFEQNPAAFVGKKAEGLLGTLAKHQDGVPKSCHSTNR